MRVVERDAINNFASKHTLLFSEGDTFLRLHDRNNKFTLKLYCDGTVDHIQETKQLGQVYIQTWYLDKNNNLIFFPNNNLFTNKK